MPTTATKPGSALYHPYDQTVTYLHALKASSLEILLLFLGVLALVVLMAAILYHGYQKRKADNPILHTLSQSHSRCLWDEVFPSHGDHKSLLLSIAGKARRTGEEYVRAIRTELWELKKSLGSDGEGMEMDLEGGMGNVRDEGLGGAERRWSSGAKVDVAEGVRRRVSSFVRTGEGKRTTRSDEDAVSDLW